MSVCAVHAVCVYMVCDVHGMWGVGCIGCTVYGMYCVRSVWYVGIWCV